MTQTAELADHIDEQVDAIISHWRETVARMNDVPEAEHLNENEFRDHIPELLDRMAERLRGRGAGIAQIGQAHGRLRRKQGYDLREVVREYGHLRTVLDQATFSFARDQIFDLDSLEVAQRAIGDVLGEAISESVTQFHAENAEAREANRSLAELQRTRLRVALRNLPVGVWVLDSDGGVVDVNDKAVELQHFPSEETIGQVNAHHHHPKYALFHPDGTEYNDGEIPAARALRGEHVSQEEMIWRVPGGDLAIMVSASPLMGHSGEIEGAVVVAQDINIRKSLEAELKRQSEIVKAASLRKTQILTALSHDARTPLNAVVLAAELLNVQFKDGGDHEIQACLKTIQNSVTNVLDLLNDLLDLSKIEAGVTTVEPTNFVLGQMLGECLSGVEPQAKQKGLAITLDIDGLDGQSVETDRAKLKQILGNLLSNAVRYTEHGRIRVSVSRTSAELRIAVDDTGPGIAFEDQAHIFDEFARLEVPRPQHVEGTGLGLAICRRLAQLLGGEILLESCPGKGSTFIVALPGSILRIAVPEVVAPPSPVLLPRAGSVVLIVEDHDSSRQTLARVLRRMGYHAIEAANGQEALDILATQRPVAILMDVFMPVMDGIATTLAIRADPNLASIAIFALTGDVTAENQRRIGEAGVDGYLEKPVTWERLERALAQIIEDEVVR